MTRLEDRLEAVAHMMDDAEGYDKGEVLVWRTVIQHVDVECFERTGKLVVTGLTPEGMTRQIAATPGLTVEEVGEALERLAQRGHLTTDPNDGSGTPRYRLFLFQHDGRGVSVPSG